ncbi:MAG: hypothetical protein JW922_10580 [Paludibacteraceae bacterium]|nr:hypothetical protein [Paludibacteraceae bacterium]
MCLTVDGMGSWWLGGVPNYQFTPAFGAMENAKYLTYTTMTYAMGCK